MRLCEINVADSYKITIYGALNYSCFSIKCSAGEFKLLKQTGVLIEEVSIYDTFVSIECRVNAERSQDLITKAVSMGIQITYYGK